MSRDIRPQDLESILGLPFTPQQLAAITAPPSPAVVIAGAGSGKTSVMSARVVWLVASGSTTPEGVLGLTFTNKAAAELAQRVREALRRLADAGIDVPDGEPTVSTYHAYAAALLREHGLRAGYEPSARLLADAARFQLAEQVVRRAPGPFTALSLLTPGLTKAVVALESELNEHLVSPEAVSEHDQELLRTLAEVEAERGSLTARPADARKAALARAELLQLVGEYREAKRAAEAVDFGDQMAGAALVAERFAEVGEAERNRYAAVLLDEYQDTSIAQKRLLLALFGTGYPVMAVGDPFQAIYGWRGASVRNITSFVDEFATPGQPAADFPLSQNNRSDERILDLANIIAEPLRKTHHLVAPLQPRADKRGLGGVQVSLHATRDDELAGLGDDVATRIASGVQPRDVAVLCRDSSAFAALYEVLTARQVPVEVVGLGGLLELPEIVDLVATLEVLDDPGANPAMVRLLTGPRWRLGPRDLALLGRRAKDLVRSQAKAAPATGLSLALAEAVAGIDSAELISLAEAVHDPGPGSYSSEARTRLRALDDELTELRRHRGDSLLDLVQRILDVTGLAVETTMSSLRVGAHHPEQLAAFLSHVSDFVDLDGSASVGAFLAFLSASVDYEGGLDAAVPSNTNSVKVMTVHKAKGLEWPVVYLPLLCNSVFPSARGRSSWTKSAQVLPYSLRGDAEDFPSVRDWSGNKPWQEFQARLKEKDQVEERRLAYVGFTRAQHELICSGHWWGPTQIKKRGPSDYLLAAHEFCLSGGGAVGSWEPEPAEATNNPSLQQRQGTVWPPILDPEAAADRAAGAELVRRALRAPQQSLSELLGTDEEAARVAGWDADLVALVAEAQELHTPRRSVNLPRSLSASMFMRFASDPAALARELARPMPRRPLAAANRGTRFHAWVENRFGQSALIDLDDLDHRDSAQDQDLATLQEAFLAGPYADRVPFAVEAPFQIILAGQVISGRIDAVYQTQPDDSGTPEFEVVDWKTGSTPADTMQLAIYRLAWAELQQVPPESVGAAFYYVARGIVDNPSDLPGREQLGELLSQTARSVESR